VTYGYRSRRFAERWLSALAQPAAGYAVTLGSGPTAGWDGGVQAVLGVFLVLHILTAAGALAIGGRIAPDSA
jgi:hypothetical protein